VADTATVLPVAEATVDDVGADTGAIDAGADALALALTVGIALALADAVRCGSEPVAVVFGACAAQPVSASAAATTTATPTSRGAGRRRGECVLWRRISP
jgi:hypothetical protein